MHNSHYTHLIKLRPLGNFFFGGENYSSENDQAFYFQKSNDFPQQTGILGLIRYELLKQNGHFGVGERITDQGKAQTFIGGGSFHPEEKRTFGVIRKLSPVFITRKTGEYLVPFRKPRTFLEPLNPGGEEHAFHPPDFGSEIEGYGYLMGKTSPTKLTQLINYTAKNDFAIGFLDLKDRKTFVLHEDVYVQDIEPQVGIFKHQTLKYRQEKDVKEQEGFFKHGYKRLKEDYAFGFFVQLEPGYKFDSQTCVFFGKERSMFVLEVCYLNGNPAPVFEERCPSNIAGQKICLSAPARIDPSIVYPFCEGVISTEQSFRSMITEVNPGWNYYANPRHKKAKSLSQPSLSPRYNLMKAGSILKIKDSLEAEQLKTLMQHLNDQNFQTIGYNHFFTL